MESFSYKESLQLVNKFIVDTGIRDFCSHTCKGACCRNIKDCSITCQEVPLTCASVVCRELDQALSFTKLYEKYWEFNTKFSEYLLKWVTRDTFFSPSNLPKIKKLRYPVSIFIPLLSVDKNKVNRQMSGLKQLCSCIKSRNEQLKEGILRHSDRNENLELFSTVTAWKEELKREEICVEK